MIKYNSDDPDTKKIYDDLYSEDLSRRVSELLAIADIPSTL